MTDLDSPPRSRHPGLIGFRISASESAGVDWSRLDETWALAGESAALDAGWLSDHLSDAARERGGPAVESLTAAAALARRVPGKGHRARGPLRRRLADARQSAR